MSEDGRVFAWGMNDLGQLGIGPETKKAAKPMLIPKLKSHTIVQIVVLHSSNFALTANGQVFAWGDNEFAQLGLDMEDANVHEPHPMESLNKHSAHGGKVLKLEASGQVMIKE